MKANELKCTVCGAIYDPEETHVNYPWNVCSKECKKEHEDILDADFEAYMTRKKD